MRWKREGEGEDEDEGEKVDRGSGKMEKENKRDMN